MDLIHHIYVIGNEEREPERIRYLKNAFLEQGIHYVTYIQPTYKNTLTDKELSRFVYFMEKHMRNIHRSEISVFLNFLAAYEDALKKYTDGYILFLESDVIFEGTLPDYLYNLGRFLKDIKPECVCIGSGCDIIQDDVNTEDMNFQIFPSKRVRCMDSLLFSIEGLRRFYDYCISIEKLDEPIDNFFETFLTNVDFSYYWVWPSITLQGSQHGHYETSIQNDKI